MLEVGDGCRVVVPLAKLRAFSRIMLGSKVWGRQWALISTQSHHVIAQPKDGKKESEYDARDSRRDVASLTGDGD